ncbi:hypothetical protein [Alicyclobacillus sp. SO9]|uniref:hypothetical protein n=1 Tax=Alicyclobacillus sp. SO9 TaxID=2665646 RepID=UPI0018E79C84|nr:hypothetical protein [Alicyclobacillus sp. SO9]QQE78268.1 hypothetical protein GI364_20685 [Alicyclobacillus sp. SO9]
MGNPSYFFVQSTSHYLEISTNPAPVLTLSVYATSHEDRVKLDSSIQFVSDINNKNLSVSIELIRNGTFLTSHVVQMDNPHTSQKENFLVITDNMTWSDTPDTGLNLYQIVATVLDEEPLLHPLFAGTRSINATVFP